MSDPKQVEIRAPFQAHGTVVTIDGREIGNLVEVTFKHRVGEPPRVFLELLPTSGASITARAEVEIVNAADGQPNNL